MPPLGGPPAPPAVAPPAATSTGDTPAVAEVPGAASPQATESAAIAGPLPAPSGPLFPEQHFSGPHHALAVSPQFGGQLLAAPTIDVRLLEQERRRASGNEGVLHRWAFQPGAESMDLRGEPSSILDLAVPGEASGFGTFPIAAVGGDSLLRSRPGLVVLHDPSYEYGAHVAHLGHTAAVTAVAFRPDGKQFVSGSTDGVLKIWSAEVHPEVVRLQAQPSATRVAFGGNGRYVAVAGRSEHWANARGFVSMRGPDGQPIVNEKARGTVKLCDIQSGKDVLTLTSGPGDVLGLAVDPELQWVAAGGEDRQVHLWDLASGQLRFEAKTPGIVRCLAVSRDGQFVAAACGDRSPFASESGGPAAPGSSPPAPAPAPPPPADAVLRDETETAHFVSFQEEPTAAPAASAKKAGTIVIWRTDTGKQTALWNAHEGDALSVAFSPDGKSLVSSGADRVVTLWQIEDTTEPRTLEAFDGEIVDLAFRPNGEEIAGAGFDPCRPDKPGEAIVWSVRDGSRRLRLASLAGLMHAVAWSPEGRRLVTSGGAWQGSLSPRRSDGLGRGHGDRTASAGGTARPRPEDRAVRRQQGTRRQGSRDEDDSRDEGSRRQTSHRLQGTDRIR